MAYHPISLGLSRYNGAAQTGSVSGLLTKEKKQHILERDDYACQCCAFRSKKYQEILFSHDNQDDVSDDNLKTVCIFCYQCFNLDKISVMRSGVLLWLPEIAQADLHHIARAIYVARISQGPIADAARKSLDGAYGAAQCDQGQDWYR